MSEEEIINYFKEVLTWYRENTPDRVYALNNKDTDMLQGLLDLYNKEKLNCLNLSEQLNKEKEKNKELEKYDYRKIKLDEKNKISSIHFTKEQLDLMNLGIALYVGIPKILADTENEETDI